MAMTGKTNKEATAETVEKRPEDTLQHYSYAPLVEGALKLAKRIKAARDRRTGVTSPGTFDGAGQNRMVSAEQAQQAKPVSSPAVD
jgi:hypothetical protein